VKPPPTVVRNSRRRTFPQKLEGGEVCIELVEIKELVEVEGE
jgi:hypothetical protein